MNTELAYRANLKAMLQASMTEQGITYSEIIQATGLDLHLVVNAVSYGVAESFDLVAICRALDLDTGGIISEAINHVGASTTPGNADLWIGTASAQPATPVQS